MNEGGNIQFRTNTNAVIRDNLTPFSNTCRGHLKEYEGPFVSVSNAVWLRLDVLIEWGKKSNRKLLMPFGPFPFIQLKIKIPADVTSN